MDKIISAGLLSEVLGKNILGHQTVVDKDNEIFTIAKEIGECEYINIHELAHKCKEWANKKGFILKSSTLEYFADCDIKTINNNDYEPNPYMTDKTESEAIFKACEWILKENK